MRHLLLLVTVVSWALCVPAAFAANAYLAPANKAVAWLNAAQNPDGSWGASDALKPLYTSEAVRALAAVNQRSSQYYLGLGWLENHNGGSVDYEARRILALATHGDNVGASQSLLASAQRLALPGNGGWGLSAAYQGSPLDTALALQAYTQLGLTTNTAQAIAYLKTSQLTGTDKGWPLAQETVSDPLTNAYVILALVPFRASDATLTTVIANAAATLNTQVNSASPLSLQALAAQALQKANVVPTALLSSLQATQGADGSLGGGDIHVTALATSAFATAMQTDLAASATPVNIPDQNLRAAINRALGHGSMDVITRGDMANLTTLNASGLGIKNLTGMEYAINLVSADFSNNGIASFAPLKGLTNLASVNETGNPGYQPVVVADSDVPTLPEWGAILMGMLLLLSMSYSARRRQR
jgi:hypothetical protein